MRCKCNHAVYTIRHQPPATASPPCCQRATTTYFPACVLCTHTQHPKRTPFRAHVCMNMYGCTQQSSPHSTIHPPPPRGHPRPPRYFLIYSCTTSTFLLSTTNRPFVYRPTTRLVEGKNADCYILGSGTHIRRRLYYTTYDVVRRTSYVIDSYYLPADRTLSRSGVNERA